jgi:hypothetical protein
MLLVMDEVVSAILPGDFPINTVWKPKSLQPCVGFYEFHMRILSNKLFTDGLLSFATISLALKVPRISDPRTQQLAVIIWGGVIFLMYSFLLSVFRIKNGGYPFWLPPFS